MIKANKKFMQLAIKKAKLARKEGDYSIGAVLAKGNKIIAVCGSRTKIDQSPVAHAEMLAIIKGSKILKNRHLKNCVLYTTHEPCPMCASLVVWTKLKGVVYGCIIQDMKKYRNNHANKEYLWRTIDIPCSQIFKKSTEKVEWIKGFMRKDCMKLFYNGK
jgi:tRNA(adenine34) deaminase